MLDKIYEFGQRLPFFLVATSLLFILNDHVKLYLVLCFVVTVINLMVMLVFMLKKKRNKSKGSIENEEKVK